MLQGSLRNVLLGLQETGYTIWPVRPSHDACGEETSLRITACNLCAFAFWNRSGFRYCIRHWEKHSLAVALGNLICYFDFPNTKRYSTTKVQARQFQPSAQATRVKPVARSRPEILLIQAMKKSTCKMLRATLGQADASPVTTDLVPLRGVARLQRCKWAISSAGLGWRPNQNSSAHQNFRLDHRASQVRNAADSSNRLALPPWIWNRFCHP